MHEGLIIANGEQGQLEKIKALAAGKTVLVLDGAYHWVEKTDLAIDYLLGDLDSASNLLVDQAKKQGVKIIEAPDQNFTDLEKGIIFLRSKGVIKIDIVSATGLRLDHTCYNLQLLTKYYDSQQPLYLHSNHELIFAIKNQEVKYKQANIGDGFAILGAPECIISSTGLRYDMKNVKLCYGERNSICNTTESNELYLSIQGSALVIHTQTPFCL